MGIHTKAVTWVVRRATGDVVAAGPFAGMRYVRGAVGSVLPPKLLGLYERELHTAIARIVAAAPDEVVDAGAAEGYYAVGLARALPRCRVTAFEVEPRGQALLGAMARLNGVAERLAVEGWCDADALRRCLNPARRTVLIMDIEGGEKEVLDPAAVPALASCDLLVEVHEARHPALADELERRFAPTHAVERIAQQERRASEFSLPRRGWTRLLSRRMRMRALDEKRGQGMSWLFMVARRAGRTGGNG